MLEDFTLTNIQVTESQVTLKHYQHFRKAGPDSSEPLTQFVELILPQSRLLNSVGDIIRHEQEFIKSKYSLTEQLATISFIKKKKELSCNGTPLQFSCLENPMDGGTWWAAVHGVAKSWTRLSNFTFTFHFHALEKEIAAHSSVLAWRTPGTVEPGGLLSMGSHRFGHD